MSNLSLWHLDSHHSELRESELKVPADGIVLSSLYSLISTGTERLVATGQVDPDLEQQMAVPYMQGSFALPIKYGYSLVGQDDRGRLYHCMHPHQQKVAVLRQAVTPLPDGASPKRMTLLSNMETVITGIWDAFDALGCTSLDSTRIGIVGFGNIGALLGITLRLHQQARPIIFEKDPWRRQKAIDLGFEVDSGEHWKEPLDLIFHASSTGAGLQWSIEHLAQHGTLVELSWYGNTAVTLHLGRHFHYNRLKLISSQVSALPQNRPGQTVESRKHLALDLLNDSGYDSLFAEDVAFVDAPTFYQQLRSDKPPTGLIWAIKY